MRVLMLSIFFPPDQESGSDVIAGEVFEGLIRKGHDVFVLTSDPRGRHNGQNPRIYPLFKSWAPELFSTRGWFKQIIYSVSNVKVLGQIAKRLNPDLIFAPPVEGLGAAVLEWLHRQPIPVVHYILGEWLTYAYENDFLYGYSKWNQREGKRRHFLRVPFGKVVGAVKRWARLTIVSVARLFVHNPPAPLDLTNAIFLSAYLKRKFLQKSFAVEKSPVVYLGLRPGEFTPRVSRESTEGIVFCSRLDSAKGLHVLFEALQILESRPSFPENKITIVGPFSHRSYETFIRGVVKNLKSRFQIHFTGQVPRKEVGEIYRRHKIFVFPSVWEEPYGLALLEAMATGLAVIASGTGGSAEFLRHEENCLLVGPGDAVALSRALERLSADPALQRHLGEGARQMAARFDLETSLEQIEAHLKSVANGRPKDDALPARAAVSRTSGKRPVLYFHPVGLGDDLMVFWSAVAATLAGILPKGLRLYFRRPETRHFLKKLAASFEEIELLDQMPPRTLVIFVRLQAYRFKQPLYLLEATARRFKKQIFCDAHLHKAETEYGRWEKATPSQAFARAVGLLRAWKPPYGSLYDGWQELSVAFGFDKEKAQALEPRLGIEWPTIVDRLKQGRTGETPSEGFDFPLLFPAGGSFQDFDHDMIQRIRGTVPGLRIVRFHEDRRPADLTFEDLEECAELIRRSSLVITNDSIPSHIAQFFAAKQVLITTRSRPENICFPDARNTVIIDLGKGLPCRPCAHLSWQQFEACPAGFGRCRPLVEIKTNGGSELLLQAIGNGPKESQMAPAPR